MWLFAPKCRHEVISAQVAQGFLSCSKSIRTFVTHHLLCSFFFSLLLLNGGDGQIRK